jgi:hypothetical protein
MGPPWHNRESSLNTRFARRLFDVSKNSLWTVWPLPQQLPRAASSRKWPPHPSSLLTISSRFCCQPLQFLQPVALSLPLSVVWQGTLRMWMQYGCRHRGWCLTSAGRPSPYGPTADASIRSRTIGFCLWCPPLPQQGAASEPCLEMLRPADGYNVVIRNPLATHSVPPPGGGLVWFGSRPVPDALAHGQHSPLCRHDWARQIAVVRSQGLPDC